MALRFGISLDILIEKKRSFSRAKVSILRLMKVQRDAEDEKQDG